MSSPIKPKVIIYENHLLALTDTFVQAQTGALSQFEPVYAGLRKGKGLDCEGQIFLLNQGGFWGNCREVAFKLTGFAPGFMESLGALHPVLLHAHHGQRVRVVHESRVIVLVVSVGVVAVRVLVRVRI